MGRKDARIMHYYLFYSLEKTDHRVLSIKLGPCSHITVIYLISCITTTKNLIVKECMRNRVQ